MLPLSIQVFGRWSGIVMLSDDNKSRSVCGESVQNFLLNYSDSGLLVFNSLLQLGMTTRSAMEATSVAPCLIKAAILYDHSDSCRRVTTMLDQLRLGLPEEMEFNLSPWRIETLADSNQASRALLDTVDASLMLIATNWSHTVPATLMVWVENWALNRQMEDAALVVMSDGSQTVTLEDIHGLREFSDRYGLTFFSDHWSFERNETIKVTEHHTDDHRTVSHLTRSLDWAAPLREWGINE